MKKPKSGQQVSRNGEIIKEMQKGKSKTAHQIQMIKKLLLLGILMGVFSLGSCTLTPPEKPGQSVFLYKDNDGLYEYDFTSGKEELIYKLVEQQVFLDQPYRSFGDTIAIGMVGSAAVSEEYNGQDYFNYEVSVSLKTGKNRESRKTTYTTDAGNQYLNIKVMEVDSQLRQKKVSDTTLPYRGYLYTHRGMIFNNDKGRFYSEHILGNKKVFTENGSVYCTFTTENGNQTDGLITNKYFDPKFGQGYFQPQLDPSGKYVICTFMPGFMKKPAALVKVKLGTEKPEVIKEGKFMSPLFSADGKFVLFRRDAQIDESGAWQSDVYVLNLKTLEETKIARASFAQWAPMLTKK